MKQEKVVLGLGSNIGDRKKNLIQAKVAIEEVFKSKSILSQIYQTEAWGFKTEELFLNCCLVIKTDLSPKQVLKATQAIEKQLGRVKKTKNNNYKSRMIDIDILYYGNTVLKTKNLTIPHPLIYCRSFVLKPLSDVLTTFIDPVKNQSIEELSGSCNDKNRVILYSE